MFETPCGGTRSGAGKSRADPRPAARRRGRFRPRARCLAACDQTQHWSDDWICRNRRRAGVLSRSVDDLQHLSSLAKVKKYVDATPHLKAAFDLALASESDESSRQLLTTLGITDDTVRSGKVSFLGWLFVRV